MVEVKKIPPLRCSHCQSTRVRKDRGVTCEDCGMREYKGKLVNTREKKWELPGKLRSGASPKVDPYE